MLRCKSSTGQANTSCKARIILPVVLSARGSLSEQASAVIQAAGRGELPTSNAHELLSAISLGLKIKEAEDLEERVGKLEEKMIAKEKG